MQDAVILTNCLYDLPSVKHENILAALEDFREQRFPKVMEQYQKSKAAASLSYGQVKRSGGSKRMIMAKSIEG